MAFFTEKPTTQARPDKHLTLCRGEKCSGAGCACWCHPSFGKPKVMFTRTGNSGGGTIPR